MLKVSYLLRLWRVPFSPVKAYSRYSYITLVHTSHPRLPPLRFSARDSNSDDLFKCARR